MEDKVEIAKKEINKILETYNLEYGYKLDFPVYRILPDEVQLAIRIIEKHKMRIAMILSEKKKLPQK